MPPTPFLPNQPSATRRPMSIAIVGFASAGKTTVFNALTRSMVAAGSYGASKGVNIGVGAQPDVRLDYLESAFAARSKVYANMEFWDMPTDYSSNDVFTREFVNGLQRARCLLVAVRAFDDPAVPHPAGSVSWLRDLEQLLFDIVFADIELVNRRIERIRDGMKALKSGERETATKNLETLEHVQSRLEDGVALRSIRITEGESRALSGMFTLSSLPLVVAVNISEHDLEIARGDINAQTRQTIAESLMGEHAEALPICAPLEEELRHMPDLESQSIREELYGDQDGSSDLMSACLDALRFETFYTASEKEVRAWHFAAGSTASQAAGVVHSDMERGFIRAEIVAYEDFQRCGSMEEARKSGVLRQEGREYPFKDGDISHFLFSV